MTRSERPPLAESNKRKSSLGTSFIYRRLAGIQANSTELEPELRDDVRGLFGLNLLHQPSEPLIDFIFVHGLGGGSRKTWSKTSDLAHFWPQQWLPVEPRFKNVRIHSFGYNSMWGEKKGSNLTIHDFGQALVAAIGTSPHINEAEKTTQIVLIGHSMGGIVIKKAFLLAKQQPNFAGLAERFHSLFFLATPHRGANLAELLSNLLKSSLWIGAKPYVDNLLPNSEAIQNINDQFRNVYQGTELWSFFETEKTSIGLIVEKSSAVLDLPGEHVQLLNADHSNVCKYLDPTDSNYCTVRNAFISTIESIEKEKLWPGKQKQSTDLETLLSFFKLLDNLEADLASVTDHQTEGTCLWFTESLSFQDWEEGAIDSPRHFWLSGEPASGKTIMAGHVVQHLRSTNKNCSFFFFKDSRAGRSSVADLLCSLAWQMASMDPDIRNALLAMRSDGISIDTDDERNIWRTVFLARILRVTPRQPHYWIVDAVDECANYALFFSFLAKVAETFKVYVFMTSRPSMAMERCYSREMIPKVSHCITLESSVGDISMFVHAHASQLWVETEYERQALIERILKGSNGNFLWTTLVIRELEDAVTKEQVQEILKSVPKEIDELYRRILTNLAVTPKNAELVRAILRWTTCVLRPLTCEEMTEALRLDIGETVSQLDKVAGSICGNLVYVDSQERVQIAHQTIREFLFREAGSFEFSMHKSLEHSRIVLVCLNFLAGDDLKPPRHRRAVPRSRKKQNSAFSKYAASFFSEHLIRTSSTNDTHLQALDVFMKNNVLTWIESVASEQNLDSLIRAAKNIKKYLDHRSKHSSPLGEDVHRVSRWTQDLIHLVAQFGKPLLSAPTSIHYLIPPICPPDSMIFKATRLHARGFRVSGLSSTQWNDRLCRITIPSCQILSVAAGDQQFALGSSNGHAYIYDEETFQELVQLEHKEPVRHLIFGRVNPLLVSAGRRRVCLWDMVNSVLLWAIVIDDEPLALEFSEDGATLMVATKGNLMIYWDIQTGTEQKRMEFSDWDEDERREYHYRRPPIFLSISPTLGLVGAAYRQRPVSFWDLEYEDFNGQFRRLPFIPPEPLIHGFLFSPNPEISLAVVAYQDGEVVVFDPFTQQIQARTHAHALSISLSPDGIVLASDHGSGNIKLYDFETMRLIYDIKSEEYNIRAMTFNKSGRRFFDIRGDYCNVWEPSVLVRQTMLGDDSSVDLSSEAVVEAPRFTARVTFDDDLGLTALRSHHSHDVVFCGRENGTVAVFSSQSGQLVQELYKHDQGTGILLLEWSETGQHIISTDRSGRTIIREVQLARNGKYQLGEPIIDRRTPVVKQILASPDGKRVLVSNIAHDEIWSLENRERVIEKQRPAANHFRRWVQNPTSPNTLILICEYTAKLVQWTNFEELSSRELLDLDNQGVAISDVVVPSQGRHIVIMIEGSKKIHRYQSMQIWPLNSFFGGTSGNAALKQNHSLAIEIRAIVGTYRSWLMFLNQDGWICSFNLDNSFRDITSYTRHFFVPSQWHRALWDLLVSVTKSGSVIMALDEEIIAFHNGLDFEELVTIPKPVESVST